MVLFTEILVVFVPPLDYERNKLVQQDDPLGTVDDKGNFTDSLDSWPSYGSLFCRPSSSLFDDEWQQLKEHVMKDHVVMSQGDPIRPPSCSPAI